jgi:imidazolonepropionase
VENLALARNAVEISAGGRVVMPGFVDSHTHLLFPTAARAELDLAAGARALRSITGMRLESRARLHLETMARHGTTTVEVKTGCGPDPSAEMKILRVLASLQQKPVDIVPTFQLRLPHADFWGAEQWPALEEWIGAEFLPKIRRRRLARFADLYWQEDTSLGASAGQYLELARRIGLGCKVHAEVASPAAAVALAAEHHAASVDHIEYASDADAAVLGGCGTVATLLPGASFHRDGRYAPARSLIDAGAAVALATNFNPHHTPTLNMQAAVQLACYRMGMTPAEAISAATINGAHALACGDTAGSLEPGKSADVLILNISDYRELAHHFGMNLVHTTIKRGEIIWEEGKVAPRPVKDLRPAW